MELTLSIFWNPSSCLFVIPGLDFHVQFPVYLRERIVQIDREPETQENCYEV